MKALFRTLLLLPLLAVALTGCMTSKPAQAIRYQLAADAKLQLEQSANEAEQAVLALHRQEVDRALSDLDARYLAAMADAGTDPQSVASVTMTYMRQVEALKTQAAADAERVLLLPAKIRAGALAIQAVNQMADSEIAGSHSALKDFIASGLMDTVLEAIAQAADAHTAATAAAIPAAAIPAAQ